MWSCLFLFVCESIAICKGGRLGPRSSVDKNILSTHTRHPITPYIRILIADRRWYDDNAIRWGHSSVSIALHCHCSMRKKSRAASIAFATIEMDQIERMNADATQHLLWVICQFSWFDYYYHVFFHTPGVGPNLIAFAYSRILCYDDAARFIDHKKYSVRHTHWIRTRLVDCYSI